MTGRAGRRPRGSATAVAAIGGLGVALLPGLLGLVPAHAVLAEEVPRTRVATTSTVKVTRDGQRAAHLSFRVRAANEAGVEVTNQAWARAACRGCRAVAISVQVIVEGHVPNLTAPAQPDRPPVVIARNIALAEDVPRGVRRQVTGSGGRAAGCADCNAMAIAYQFVVVGKHRLRLTPAARSRLATIERQMRAEAIWSVSHGVSNGLLQARMDRYSRQILSVLATGVVLWPH
ncbi:MAG: hypothetical protein IPJ14_06105 [Kineosporiaceae bacterium]|nr:hypothetical protein [Kineosporiaceae bacterium]